MGVAPQSSNPFADLGLPVRFDLSPAQIERAYLSRIAQQHPDLASADPYAGEAELQGEAAPAHLNAARQVLTHAESRARALLYLLAPGALTTHANALPPGFLAQILEVREEVEPAIASSDAGARATREHWRAWALSQRALYEARAAELFAALAATPSHAATPHVSALAAHLNAWRYIERLLEQLDPPPATTTA